MRRAARLAAFTKAAVHQQQKVHWLHSHYAGITGTGSASSAAAAFGHALRQSTLSAGAAAAAGLHATRHAARGHAATRDRLQLLLQQQRHHVQELEQRWQRLEARMVALVNGVSIAPAGQALLAATVPLVLLPLVFPSRFRASAYSTCAAPVTHFITPAEAVLRSRAWRPALWGGAAHGRAAALLDTAIEEMALAGRALYLAALFAPVALTAPLALQLGIARGAWVQLLLWTLEHAGPAFIKWGQWASSRPDLLPRDVCRALSSLQSAAPSHEGRLSVAAVEAAFGRPLGDVFASFEVEPIASGSIAQIHRARLSAQAAAAVDGAKPGMEVAVKVRHPGVSEVMVRDFVLMQRAAALTKRVPSLASLRLDESVRQFGAPLHEQLDLRREAEHLRRFRTNFRAWRSVQFPRPLMPLVASDVLVETFEDGDLMAGLLDWVESPLDVGDKAICDQIAQTGLDAYLQMLLRDNFIHADMHPGNILVRTLNPGSTGAFQSAARALLALAPAAAPRPQLVILDTGMIAELHPSDKDNMVDFFKALTDMNGERLAHSVLRLSEGDACVDPNAFVADMKTLFDALDPDIVRANTSGVMRDMIETLRQHSVTLKGTISTVVVTTLVLEGWSHKFNPDLHIMDTLRDVLAVDWRDRIGRAVDRIMAGGGDLAVV